MIIYYHCTDIALLPSFLLTCHPYIPFHFMNTCIVYSYSICVLNELFCETKIDSIRKERNEFSFPCSDMKIKLS